MKYHYKNKFTSTAMSPLFTDRNKGSQIERKRWGSLKYCTNLAKTNPASEFLFVVRHMGRPGYWFWFDCCHWENVSGRSRSLFETNPHYLTPICLHLGWRFLPIATGCSYQKNLVTVFVHFLLSNFSPVDWSLPCL